MRRFLIFVALFCLASPGAVFAADRYERFLDPSLKVLYRAQQGAGDLGQRQAEDVLARLHGSQVSRSKTSARGLLNLVIKFHGDQSRLMESGFSVESCVGPICTGTLSADRLSDLVKVTGIHFVQMSRPIPAAVSPSSSAPASQIATTELTDQDQSSPTKDGGGTGALIAFIDTGVDIFHQDFRLPGGDTRIKLLLDFSDPGDINGDGILDGPGPYGGTLYNETEINTALGAGSFASTDSTGHGTHGLSIAAGDDSTFPGVAPSADLIVVKGTREDGSLGFYSSDIINALSWVDEQATILAQPYVVNLSLGSTFCSHDGRSLEEQAIDALVGPGISGKAAVIAAGNASANRSSQFHHFTDTAYVGLDSSHTLTVPAYTPIPDPGNDRILVDIWYEGRDELAITVTGPASCGSPVITADFGHYQDQPTACGDVFIANMGGANPLNGDMEAIILIDDWSGTPPAPGEWTITFTGEAIGDDGVYHGWLAEESMVGMTSPYLSTNAENRYLVGKPGGAVNGITVGSYALHDASAGSRFLTSWTDVNGIGRLDSTAVDGDISDFSSPGPTRDGRVKPELAAPGERVMGAVSQEAWPGVSPVSIYQYHPWPEPDALLTDDTPDHAFGMLQGTSFAAPVITGLAARLLSEDPSLDAIQIRNMILNTATTDPTTGDVPSDEWGYGKADYSVGSSAPLPSDLRITTDVLPDGYVGEQYNLVFTASGGTLPYSWSLASGDLPAGLVLETSGYLGGVLTTAGSFTFTVEVTDDGTPAKVAIRAYQVLVSANQPLDITKVPHPVATIGLAYESQVEASGGVAPYSWTIVGGTLPSGIQLETAGVLAGTPVASGRYDFTVRVQDSAAGFAYKALQIEVVGESGESWNAIGKSNPTIHKIVIDPNDTDHLLVSTRNIDAIFETTNGGQSWHAKSINNNFNSYGRELGISPISSTLWALNNRWYRFDTSSEVWEKKSVYQTGGMGDDLLTVDFDVLESLYTIGYVCLDYDCQQGTQAFCALRTDDQGDSWATLGQLGFDYTYGQSSTAFSIHKPDPDFLYISGMGTLFSSDAGSSWAEVENGSGGGIGIRVSQSNPFDVVKVNSSGLWRTVTGGRTWDVLSLGSSPTCLERSASLPNLLLIGTETGLLASFDAGQSLSPLPIGPAFPAVSAVAIDPSDSARFFVGTDIGLFLTSDGGATWSSRGAGLIRRTLRKVEVSSAIPEDVVLVSVDGLYVSRTAGESWTFSNQGLADLNLRYPAVSAADPDLLWIVNNDGVFRSDNKGVTWSEPDPSFADGYSVVALAAHTTDADIVMAGQEGTRGTYRSTDRGSSWHLVGGVTLPFSQPTDIDFAHDQPSHVFVSFVGDGVWRSTDTGDNWSSFGLAGNTVNSLVAAPSDSGYLYAWVGGSSTLFFRNPGVGVWTAATVGPPRPVLALAVDGVTPNVAYAGCDHPGTAGSTGGIYITTDSGRNWARIPGVLDSFDVVSIATHPSESGVVWAATRLGGVFRSEDGGQTWELLSNFGTIADLTNINLQDPTNEFLLFAGTEGYGVQVSTDGGKTFEPRVNGLTNYYVNAMSFDPDDPTILYAGTDAGVFKTTDAANTWVPTDLIAGAISDIVTDNDGTARRIWVTVAGEGVAFSGDGGATFAMYDSGLASLELTSIEVEDLGGTARRIWVTTHRGDGVAYSDDLGQTWVSAAGNGLTDRDVNDLLVDGAARRIWVTANTGVFYSDNDGLSWNDLSLGLPSETPVTSVSLDPNTSEVFVSLFSNHGGGVYRGANLTGSWRDFSDGLKELRVKKLTNNGGASARRQSSRTRFFAATRGDGVYRADVVATTGSAPSITTTSLADGVVTMAYERALVATGGTAPYNWSVISGSLPPGIALDAQTGTLFGSPGFPGLYQFSARVTDDQLMTAEAELQIRVHQFEGQLFWDDFESGSTSAWSNDHALR